MSTPEPKILDTTLRDGSYVIDFQFTAEDTALITSLLQSAGIELIEVAHGLGLGAARSGHGQQASSDAEYMRAAVDAAGDAKVGVFFIPGIGNEDDLRSAAGAGISFVRVGTNVNAVADGAPYIELGKQLGLTVFANLMKSYAVPPDEFALCAAHAANCGADYVCLVDSAGGMLPADVRTYLKAAQAQVAAPLGFHGHNNLAMAIANTVEAADAGAAVLDTTLQGMGRQAGNAVTEILVALFQTRGQMKHIDLHALQDTSEAFVQPLLPAAGHSAIGITTGQAQFHSSFLGRVLSASSAHGIDARDLVLRLSERDKINAPEELIEELAQDLARRASITPVAMPLPAANRQGGLTLQQTTHARAREVLQLSKKSGAPGVFNIVVGPYESAHVSPHVDTQFGCVISNVMLTATDDVADIATQVDGLVDYVLLDAEHCPPLKASKLLRYSDVAMWRRAVTSQLRALLGGEMRGRLVAIIGVPELTDPLAATLLDLGVIAHVLDPTENVATVSASLAGVDALVGFAPRTPCVERDHVTRLPEGAIVFDAGIGSIAPAALAEADRRDLRVVRVDMRPALAATALELIHTDELVHHRMGRDSWDAVAVIAGGLIGSRGEIIVDSIQHPTRVIGVADGQGGILQPTGENDAVETVRRAIALRRLRGSDPANR